MRSRRTVAAWLGVALGVAAGAAGRVALGALRRTLPRTSGRLALDGLTAPVRVMRDQWGVPHIYAENTADLFMAQGFVHAQERLWQMEFQRRVGAGRLSEMFGEIALDTDRFVRILGFARVAEREVALLSDGGRAAVDAYVRGINAFIAANPRRLPIEFTLLRFRPEPWRAADVLVWGKMMAQNLSRSWVSDLLRANVVAAVGSERAALLEPDYLADHPLTLPQGIRPHPDMGVDALRMESSATFLGNGEAGQGSNAWVVGGQRSATGRPLLANDVHLRLQVPSLWFENHLSAGSYHVTGASLPGAPGVIIGHNERIAWGITNGENDVQDLYVERFNPTDAARYQFRDEWLQAEVFHERISVKGRATPHVEEVRVTRHGPVMSSFVPDDRRPTAAHTSANGKDAPREELALRWTALEPSPLVDAVLMLDVAHDWPEFRAAVAQWTCPASNFVYADVEGHFGYAFGGQIPLRAQGDGRLPMPGWSGEYEWTGFIPPLELPHAFDPDEGYVVTANNRIIGDEYPYPIPSEWLPGYRAERITQLLEQTQRHDEASFSRIQSDQRSLPGLELSALAGRLSADTPLARAARDELAAWDGDLTANSAGGAIYARLRAKLLDAAFEEIAGPLAAAVGWGAFAELPGGSYLWRALPELLRRLAARDDRWLPAGRTGDQVLHAAWFAALAELRNELGDDAAQWTYGRAHTVTLRHPLGSVPAFARLLNRGPFRTGGDADTVRMGLAGLDANGQEYYVAPSYRQICDLSSWDRSLSIHPPGQSGHPASKHYADFIKPYLTMQYHPMLWSRARVEDVTVGVLVLEP